MKSIELKNNKLLINFDLRDDFDKFSMLCLDLLDTEEEDLEIIISDAVVSLSSRYIGVIISTEVKAQETKKKLTIDCNERLYKLFNIIGGSHLHLVCRKEVYDLDEQMTIG